MAFTERRARAPAVPAIHLTAAPSPASSNGFTQLNLNLSTETAWHSMKAGEGARGPSNSLDRRSLARLKQRIHTTQLESVNRDSMAFNESGRGRPRSQQFT